MSRIAAIFGRLLLAVIFIVSGVSKLADISGTEAAISSVGLPSGLAIPVGIFELTAGILLALGFMTQFVAILLFIFVGFTILFFHHEFTDPVQSTMALKNLAIMGGLLLAFAHSFMWWHYDSIRRERKAELAARDAERRAHDAEIRAARAEAAAEAVTADRETVVTEGVPEVHRRRRWFDW
ncbi:MAG: DoxX family protein [Novosphingobium sp.]|nr:DoxX family protein [Novosphingobium sp.]